MCVSQSHSYASASYQGPLCLIELRSCFPFISELQRRVILQPSNETFNGNLAMLLSELLGIRRNAGLDGETTKQDNEMWTVSTLHSIQILSERAQWWITMSTDTQRNLNSSFCMDCNCICTNSFFFSKTMDQHARRPQTSHPINRTVSYATLLRSSTSAVLLISPNKATHHWVSAVHRDV